MCVSGGGVFFLYPNIVNLSTLYVLILPICIMFWGPKELGSGVGVAWVYNKNPLTQDTFHGDCFITLQRHKQPLYYST